MFTIKSSRGFLRLALFVGALAVFSQTRADPDLWGHVRFGHDMAAAHAVHLADHYSFTSDRAWINHEWLSEVVLYFAYAAGGSAGLIALKIVLLLVMLGGVMTALVSSGVPKAARDLLVALVVASTVPQAHHVRPQLFSLALFAWLLAVLLMAERRPRAAMAAVPMLVIWANLHGGWIVGAGTLVVWTVLRFWSAAPIREKMRGVLIAAIALAMTAANPYGWHLWAFLAQTVGLSRPDIVDWQPVYRLGTIYVFLWGIVALAASVAIARAALKRSLDLRMLIPVLIFGAAAFRVSRLQAFFAIAFVALMGTDLLSSPTAEIHEPRDDRTGSRRLGVAMATAVALAILTASVTAAVRNAACIRLDPEMFPDAGVVVAARSHGLQGRMLTWFDWGEYAIWYWGPGVAVSMDGRRETLYSDAAIQRHLAFYFDPRERQAVLDALHPDYIWLPPRLDVVDRLRADGWRPVFEGPQSMLLARNGDSTPAASQGPATEARCFPGP
jgi:hypothetical protein